MKRQGISPSSASRKLANFRDTWPSGFVVSEDRGAFRWKANDGQPNPAPTDFDVLLAKRCYSRGWTIYVTREGLVASPNFAWEVWQSSAVGVLDDMQYWAGCDTEQQARNLYLAALELQDAEYDYGKRGSIG